MENSNIEWTDHTFNPWTGCTKVSPGCAHCYAESWAKRSGTVQWGPGKPRRRTKTWGDPVKWNRGAEEDLDEALHDFSDDTFVAPPRPRVFSASLADWLLLTKRPQNFKSRLKAAYSAPGMGSGQPETDWIWHWANNHGSIPHNVWIGTTVEDQQRANERIPHLLNIPAKVRFLSCEPLLGPVELEWLAPAVIAGIMHHNRTGHDGGGSGEGYECDECNFVKDAGIPTGIHWVICGGESGPGARPMHPDWARSLRDQCAAASVPFFFKQWGEWLPGEATPDSGTGYRRCDTGEFYSADGTPSRQNFGTHPDPFSGKLITLKIGKHKAGRHLDGQLHSAFPTP